MTKTHVLIAFYSAEAARKYGVVIYRNELGQKFACTAVSRMPREEAMKWFRGEYKWADKKVVAEVCDDCIGHIEGETETQYVYHRTRFGEVETGMSMHVPGTPGVFHSYNSYIPTAEERTELVGMAKMTTGYSPLAPFTKPVNRHRFETRSHLHLVSNEEGEWEKLFPQAILDRVGKATYKLYQRDPDATEGYPLN